MTMTEDNTMMLPEEALNRFQKPDTALLGLDVSAHDYQQPRYGFKVSNVGLLISPETMCEVMKNFTVYPVPNTKPWMHGLVNLRGNLIPVYDLSMLLGLSEYPVAHKNLLVMDKGSDSVGILIDTLPQPCDLRRCKKLSHVPNLPAGLKNCIADAYSVDDVLWLGFNHKEYFHYLMDTVSIS
jgi:twitching motility protein PilI